jgi:hypothetical protein
MAERVKPNLRAPVRPSPNGQNAAQRWREPQLKVAAVRFPLITVLLLLPIVAVQGCTATRSPESLAAEEARHESEEDAACRDKGAPSSETYEACRKNLAEARAQQGAVQEQKRRDFDRTLGAGTDGQSSY